MGNIGLRNHGNLAKRLGTWVYKFEKFFSFFYKPHCPQHALKLWLFANFSDTDISLISVHKHPTTFSNMKNLAIIESEMSFEFKNYLHCLLFYKPCCPWKLFWLLIGCSYQHANCHNLAQTFSRITATTQPNNVSFFIKILAKYFALVNPCSQLPRSLFSHSLFTC